MQNRKIAAQQEQQQNLNLMLQFEKLREAKDNFSSEIVLPSIDNFLLSCRTSLARRHYQLPFFYFRETILPSTFQFTIEKVQQICLTTASLKKFLRILELLLICRENIQLKKTITKRNLFYKLQHHYNKYSQLDKDLKLICHNLFYFSNPNQLLCSSINKTDLGIIASNRCVLFGPISLVTDGQILAKDGWRDDASNLQIITLPTCRLITAKTKVKKVLLVEKESMFYEIVNNFKQFQLDKQYLIISAKGYPDHNTRNLLEQICNQKNPPIESIYYLGDMDVYGYDIFLFYALGDWNYKGILEKIRIIELANIGNDSEVVDMKVLKPQLKVFTSDQEKKIKQIKAKLEDLTLKVPQESEYHLRVEKMSKYFTSFVAKGVKCQLQLFSQYAYDRLWVHTLIKNSQSK